MGAIVVNALSSANWAKSKPADYKGQDLDKALKAFEALSGKASITIPGNLIPQVPKAAVGAIESCIKDLNTAVSELQKGLAILKPTVTVLQAIQGAATKTAGELSKMAKDKDGDKGKYENAAASANAAGSAAANLLRDLR